MVRRSRCWPVLSRALLGGFLAVGVAAFPPVLGQTGALAQMAMPKEEVTTKILWPPQGQVVTSNAVPVIPEFSHWTERCDLAGTKVTPGAGHYHAYLDGSLVNMFCGPALVSLQNVKPGKHTLTVIPAENDHAEVESAKASVTVDYEPSHALPWISAGPPGTPRIRILYPRNGATVHGAFPLVVDVSNFLLSCDLYGKARVSNAGHWHVNVDTMTGPMMGMATMLGMSCTNSMVISTAGIPQGRHTFYAFLVDTLHEPLARPVVASVTLTVR
jgi:hypothetical protein